jgi:hypothetical protein
MRIINVQHDDEGYVYHESKSSPLNGALGSPPGGLICLTMAGKISINPIPVLDDIANTFSASTPNASTL